MEKFNYHGLLQIKRLFMQLAGMTAILVFNSVAILLIYAVRRTIVVELNVNFLNNPRVPFYGLAIGFMFVSWVIGGGFSTFLPTIWIDDYGITISAFLLLRIRIPWSSIINISPVYIGMGSFRTKYTLIVAKKISLFHGFVA